jgi:hypothetical protein
MSHLPDERLVLYNTVCELNAIWLIEKGGMNAHPVALIDAREICV